MAISFPGGSTGKESSYNAGDPSSIPGSGRSTGEGIGYPLQYSWASLVGSAGKESACNAGDLGWIPGLGRSPGEGKGYPLQYSWENSMDCIVQGVTKSWTWLSDFHMEIKRRGWLVMWWSQGGLRWVDCGCWWRGRTRCGTSFLAGQWVVDGGLMVVNVCRRTGFYGGEGRLYLDLFLEGGYLLPITGPSYGREQAVFSCFWALNKCFLWAGCTQVQPRAACLQRMPPLVRHCAPSAAKEPGSH